MSLYDWTEAKEKEVLEGDAKPEVYVSLQWKGTDACMDFRCKCGAHHHLDDEFIYGVKCLNCGRVYRMGCRVLAFEVTDPDMIKAAMDHCTKEVGTDE